MSNDNINLCACGCCEGNEQLTPEVLYNSPGLSALHFRVGTHYSFKESMLTALAKWTATRKLTTRDDDDFAIASLDAWATVLDVLSFYQERILNEGYLRTATERLSVLELAQHINYKPKPGVAASTYLAFSMNESSGAPPKAVIPVGTKVQSIPEQDQLPQIFETIEELEARVEWNNIKLLSKEKKIPVYGDKEIYLKGINTGLQPGDGILMIGKERKENPTNENWDFRRVKEITTDNDRGFTKVTWDRGLGKTSHGKKVLPAAVDFRVYAMKQKAFLFGYNAPDFRSMAEIVKDSFNPSTKEPNDNTDWLGFTISQIAGADETIYLDAIYSKIIKGNWLVLAKSDYEEVYEVDDAFESAKKDFTLTSKTTVVKVKGENLKTQFDSHVRDAVVFAQSEEFEIAEKPITKAPVGNIIEIEKILPDFPEKKMIIISGKHKRLIISPTKEKLILKSANGEQKELSPGDSLIITAVPDINQNTLFTLKDSTGFTGTISLNKDQWEFTDVLKTDELLCEIHTIKSVVVDNYSTTLTLESNLANYYDRASVTVYANIANSTHGETKEETLGSGNGSLVFQKFELKQKPLTYVSAASASGIATTLEIRVSDILWKEVISFYGVSPKEKVYTVNINDGGKVTVQFGDGITGARLPTGTENVKAKYRVGIGTDGMLKASSLTMLMTPQLGVNRVDNPLPTSGAEDKETIESAKKNVPFTVLTLDRIVSVKDFEDYASAFAGISKARADLIWNGEQKSVFITIASADTTVIDKESDLYENLLAAIKSSGKFYKAIYLENYEQILFSVDAKVKIDSAYLFENVQKTIEDKLKEKFSFDARNFGQDVTPAEVITSIQQVEGVVYVDLELLDGHKPFEQGTHYRISSEIARRSGANLLPAQLLIIDSSNISISQVLT